MNLHSLLLADVGPTLVEQANRHHKVRLSIESIREEYIPNFGAIGLNIVLNLDSLLLADVGPTLAEQAGNRRCQ